MDSVFCGYQASNIHSLSECGTLIILNYVLLKVRDKFQPRNLGCSIQYTYFINCRDSGSSKHRKRVSSCDVNCKEHLPHYNIINLRLPKVGSLTDTDRPHLNSSILTIITDIFIERFRGNKWGIIVMILCCITLAREWPYLFLTSTSIIFTNAVTTSSHSNVLKAKNETVKFQGLEAWSYASYFTTSTN